MKNCFKIAWRNLCCYKRITIKIVIAFCALLFLVTLFPSFIFSTQDKHNEMKTKYISANYIVSENLIKDSQIHELEYSNQVEYIDIASSSSELFGINLSYVPMHIVEFEIEGEIYTSRNQTDGVYIYSTDDKEIFNKNDFRELGKQDKSTLIIGDFPQNSNEIMLAEYMFEQYNFSKDMIGKKISMLSVSTGKEIFKELTICGIIKQNYYLLSGHLNGFSQFAPSIIINETNKICSVYSTLKQYIYSLDKWPSNEVVQSFISNGLDYKGTEYLKEINTISKIQNMLLQLFLYVGVALIFGIALIIFLLMYKLLDKLTQNNGILLAVGINYTHLLVIWLMQLLIISLISLIVTILLIAIGYIIINSILFYSFGVKYLLAISRVGILFLIGGTTILIFSTLSIFSFYINLNKKSIRNLIDS